MLTNNKLIKEVNMENLHLKNINPNNIKHTKSTIKYMLLNTDIRHYKIEKFKQDYIEDLYYPLNNTEHLISIGQEMIDIFNVLKDLQQNKQISDKTLNKLEQINPDRIDIYPGIYCTEYIIKYSTKKDPWYDKDFKKVGIDINQNNEIQSIYKIIE